MKPEGLGRDKHYYLRGIRRRKEKAPAIMPEKKTEREGHSPGKFKERLRNKI